MHCHIIRHIVVYHRVCYGYHGACDGYHHSLTMMITVTCTMITVTYTMIYHYMPDDMTVHVWWWQDMTDFHYMTDDSFCGVAKVSFLHWLEMSCAGDLKNHLQTGPIRWVSVLSSGRRESATHLIGPVQMGGRTLVRRTRVRNPSVRARL